MAKKNIPVEDRQFGVHWMDSCHQETLLPDSPWHKVGHGILLHGLQRDF